jgi:hypothetical protein
MTEPLFQGPKLKIERAERHIADLQAALDAFLARDPYSIDVKDDAERGERYISLSVRETIPPTLGPIAGDAIHNLRSALDIMVCDIAIGCGAEKRKARFPFAKDANGLEAIIFTDRRHKEKYKEIVANFPECIDLIKAYKPYKTCNGGNKLLRALHDLDIVDKHEVVVMAAEFFRIGHSDAGQRVTIRQAKSTIGDVAGMIFPLGQAPYEQPQLTPTITIGNGQPFQGEPILATLVSFASLVKDMLEAFDALCRP